MTAICVVNMWISGVIYCSVLKSAKHFKVKGFKISETGPPFHMYCRCMIMPYEGSALKGGKLIGNDIQFSD